MSGKLVFTASSIAEIVKISQEGTIFRISFEEQFDPANHVGGTIKLDGKGYPDTKNIDPKKLGPKLWLVKDRGVYLMSNAVTNDAEPPRVVYASGLSPQDDYYDHSRDIMGGDDCVIPLPVDEFDRAIKAGATEIHIMVTPSSVRILSGKKTSKIQP